MRWSVELPNHPSLSNKQRPRGKAFVVLPELELLYSRMLASLCLCFHFPSVDGKSKRKHRSRSFESSFVTLFDHAVASCMTEGLVHCRDIDTAATYESR